jgi:hypothetical protein
MRRDVEMKIGIRDPVLPPNEDQLDLVNKDFIGLHSKSLCAFEVQWNRAMSVQYL